LVRSRVLIVAREIDVIEMISTITTMPLRA